jgi:predicted small metal-binding protein
MVTTSGEYKLKNKLMSTKDKKDPKEKCGIYEIKCGTQSCGYKYISQTKRSIKTRYKEHITNNHHEMSSVANHMNNKLHGG